MADVADGVGEASSAMSMQLKPDGSCQGEGGGGERRVDAASFLVQFAANNAASVELGAVHNASWS